MEAKQIKQLASKAIDHTITMNDLVDNFGASYYCNAKFHLGQMISRMVKKGEFIRIKKGVYKLNFSQISKGKSINISENQTTLF